MVKRNPTAFLGEEVKSLKEKNLFWHVRVLDSASKPRAIVEGKKVILLNSNNYLNLATHPKVVAAAVAATQKWGAGAGAVPVISGTNRLERDFEEKLAKFKGVESALVCQTGFAVNAGLIPQLAGQGDVIISDELNHGSIIDGVRLTKAERAVYKHADAEDLRVKLKEADGKGVRRILVITDGVFSMDGDIAPMPQIVEACEEYGAMVFVDDCHGEGVLGKGRGIVSHFKLQGRVHVEGGSLGKGFGTFGGTICGSRDLIEFAFNKSRTWLLSTAQPPSVMGASIAALDVIETEPQHVENLWKNTEYFKKRANEIGFDTGMSQTPIIPLMIRDSGKAQEMARIVFDRGVFATPIVYPMVAQDKARIRAQMNAGLTTEDLDEALAAFEYAGRKVGVL
ncbi:8-amino-7-oxononanoate synthase [Candidatus Micrarchaeota archaeon CG08_land_8_20_14_0_20_59_11]|nr:MAG: 8-amino-7-oxononanoate synthase [Candidatus Micrarchaeota archaeon CG08_land_8_20_14_0_20_59_11]